MDQLAMTKEPEITGAKGSMVLVYYLDWVILGLTIVKFWYRIGIFFFGSDMYKHNV